MEVEDNKENVDQKDEDIIGEFNCLLLIEVAIKKYYNTQNRSNNSLKTNTTKGMSGAATRSYLLLNT